MALADIAQKILAAVDDQVKVLEQDFVAQQKKLDGKFADKEKSALAELEQKTEKALTDVEQKISAMARQENKKALLQARRNVLDQAMEALLTALQGADKSAKESIYKKLLAEVDSDQGELRVAPADEALFKSLAKGLSVKTDQHIKGGFMLTLGGAEVDNTFENLVYSVYRDDLEMYFADQLKLVS